MAKEIQVAWTTGRTVYAQVLNETGQAWNTSGTPAYESYATANIANYAIALTEQGSASGVYMGTMPAVAAGVVGVIAYDRAGGSPAESDTKVGVGQYQWSGTAVVSLSSRPTAAQVATAVFQDTTAGDFTVAGSIGKSLFTGGAVPGAAGGLAIAGSNAATTFATLTVSGATTLTGAVSLGSTLNVTGTTTFTGVVTATAGIVANITGNLSGSVGSVSGAVGSVTGAVGSVAGNVGGNVVGTVASVVGAVGSVTGAVGSVTGAVGSVTGNVGGNVTGTVASVVGNVGGNVTGTVASVVGAVGSVTGAVGSVTGNVGGNVVGTVASVVGAVGSVTGNVGGNVVGTVASVVGAVGSVTGNVDGNVTGTIGGLTTAALAQFFTLNSGQTYALAVAGSVVAEIASNAGGGGVGDVNVVTIEGGDATNMIGAVVDNRLAAYGVSTYAGGPVASVTGNVGGSVASVGAGVVLTSAGLDAVMIEAGLHARHALSVIAAACAGKGGEVSNAYKGAGVAATRITFVAIDGERTSVSLNLP